MNAEYQQKLQEAQTGLSHMQRKGARELYSQAIKYACLGKYVELEILLGANSTHDSEVHDLVASIALKSNDRKLFQLTDNHPRILLSDYAADEELFPRLVEWYFEGGYEDGNGVPNYVWEACTLENAKILAYFTGDVPEDYVSKEKDVAWKTFFQYDDSLESDQEQEEEDCADGESGAVLPNALQTTQPPVSIPWISMVSEPTPAHPDSGRETMARLLAKMKELRETKDAGLQYIPFPPIPMPKIIVTYPPGGIQNLSIESFPEKQYSSNDSHRKREVRGFFLYRNDMHTAWFKEDRSMTVSKATRKALPEWLTLPSENKKFYTNQVPQV